MNFWGLSKSKKCSIISRKNAENDQKSLNIPPYYWPIKVLDKMSQFERKLTLVEGMEGEGREGLMNHPSKIHKSTVV